MPNLEIITMDSRVLHIEVDGDDTIEDIKHKVEEKMWIAPHKQKLICDDIELKNRVKVTQIMEQLTKSDFKVHLIVKGNITDEDINCPPVGEFERSESQKSLLDGIKDSKLCGICRCSII